MRRKLITAAAGILCCFMLCGCALFTEDTAELLKSPALSEDISEIAEAIRQSAGDDYTLIYPSRGRYRSAVVREDMDNDGVAEAIAFYAKTEGEETVAYTDIFCLEEGEWRSLARQRIVAGGVDQVALFDLDGDGKKEIAVGWEIYGTSEMQLAVYAVSGKELAQLMLEQYTGFACCDLSGNRKGDILFTRLNAAEQVNTAFWYAWDEESRSIRQVSACLLDSSVKTAENPVVAALSSGKTAVYLDEIKGVGAVTEVLFAEKNRLVNPLLNPESGETSATLRSALFTVRDINGDGVTKIPVQRSVPSVLASENNEKLYLTDWCSFDGKTLTTRLTAMMNTADGYYYILPESMTEGIAVLKDTDTHLREIYRFESKTGRVSDLLLSFVTVPAHSDGAAYRAEGYKEILSDEVWTYYCRIGNTDIPFSDVKASFRIME